MLHRIPFLASFTLAFGPSLLGAQDFKGAPPPAPAVASPLSPVDQQKTFTLPPGFVIELVASEPDIPKPITVSFDHAGRMWVITAREYPIDANESVAEAKALYANGGRDQVLVFDPPAADGRRPAPRVFVDKLAMPMAVLPYKNGVLVGQGADIYFFQDTDGDGKADKKETLLTGFGIQDSHLLPHQFTRGPGDWIYMAQGAFNSSRVQTREGTVIPFDQCKMGRFQPDGGLFEVVESGLNNIWGFVIDRRGEMFIQEANDLGYSMVPFHIGASYPGIGMNKMRPYSPWQPSLASFRMGGTGLSGLAKAEDAGAFPGAYHDVTYVANPITSRIQAIKTVAVEGGHRLELLPDFVLSSDPWFRPVAVQMGPEGALYIVDWYNKIISHNEVPRTHPERDKTRGRIWRVRHAGYQAPAPADLTQASPEKLIASLSASTTWEVRAAREEIIDRKLTSLIPTLERIAGGASEKLELRLAALWAREGLSAVEPPFLKQLVGDKDRHIRREAVRIMGRWQPSGWVAALTALLRTETDPQVRFAAAQAFAGSRDSSSVQAVMQSIQAPLTGPTTKAEQGGVTVATGAAADREFERYWQRRALEGRSAEVRRLLESADGASLSPEGRLLGAVSVDEEYGARQLAKEWPGLDRPLQEPELAVLVSRAGSPEVDQAWRKAFEKEAVRDPLLRQLRDAKFQNIKPEMRAHLQTALDSVSERGLSPEQQRLMLDLKLVYQVKGQAMFLKNLSNSKETPEETRILSLRALRLNQEVSEKEAMEWIGRSEWTEPLRKEVLPVLVASQTVDPGEYWRFLSPALRRTALQEFAVNRSRSERLLTSLHSKKVDATELDPATVEKLRIHLDGDERFEAIVEALNLPKQEGVRLSGKPGSYVRGDHQLTGPFTVESWVWLDPGVGNEDGLLGSPGRADLNFAGGAPRFYLGPSLGDRVTSKKQVLAQVWVHVAVTRDPKGTLRLYLNGDLEGESTVAGLEPIGPLQVGRTTPAGASTKGRFLEYRIWNVERTQEEIRGGLYASYQGEKDLPSNMVYRLDPTTAQFAGEGRREGIYDGPSLLTSKEAAEQSVLTRRIRTLADRPGDAAKGREIVKSLCLNCHAIGGEGGQIGPNLSGAGAMGVEALLRSVLTPNAAIESGYRRYRVELKNGDLVEGFLVSSNEKGVLLRQLNLPDLTIAHSEISSGSYTRFSMMPEGLVTDLPDADVTDLFAYLKGLKP